MVSTIQSNFILQTVDTCCCRKDTDSISCKSDASRCGLEPAVKEMVGKDAEILCGEWETEDDTKEEYNILLPITEIVRHPDFDTVEGPVKGNDIAVFKGEQL